MNKIFVIPFRVTKITKLFYLESLELYGISGLMYQNCPQNISLGSHRMVKKVSSMATTFETAPVAVAGKVKACHYLWLVSNIRSH